MRSCMEWFEDANRAVKRQLGVLPRNMLGGLLSLKDYKFCPMA